MNHTIVIHNKKTKDFKNPTINELWFLKDDI